MRPTPQQLARFRAHVQRDLRYYRGCLARVDDHTPLHVAIGLVVARLATLDEYLATPALPFTREELAQVGSAVDVPVRGQTRNSRGADAADHRGTPLVPPERRP